MTQIRTKIFRVHLAGGIAIDVLAPQGSVVDLQLILSRALALARRYFALVADPLPTRINAAQSLPGDVAYIVAPRSTRAKRR